MHEGEGEKLPLFLSQPTHHHVGDGLVSPPVPAPRTPADGLIPPSPEAAAGMRPA
jgi:hypothetical protein